jgi:hypothetical protein
MNVRSGRVWLGGGLLVLLLMGSVYLAYGRIYQVDEAQNLYMARIIGTHQAGSYAVNPELWLLGPMAWLARSVTASAELFWYSRLLFLAVFWGNLVLMALNSGARLRSREGLLVLLGAATLAPLWDYGFEVRHDNLLLMGLLLMWYVGRTRPRGRASYVVLGFLTVLLPFIAFKASAYAVPLALALLVFPPPGHRTGRLRLLTAWTMGALVAYLLCRGALGLSGLGAEHAAQAKGMAIGASLGQRFGLGLALFRPLLQTPLLVVVAFAALASLGRQLVRAGRGAWTWDSLLPEALLWLGSLAALAINPTPFPYNLVNVVPFAFLLAVRFLPGALAELKTTPARRTLLVSLLVFAQMVPFLASTRRHLDHPNRRQKVLMAMAEALTDPRRDPVYDGIGMVPTRPSIGRQWYLHSLNIEAFNAPGGPRVSAMMAANPPAVIIPSYRMAWLPMEDWDFIRGHYLPVTHDFWVLGQFLPAGGTSLAILHGGRYLVYGQQQGPCVAVPGARLDGTPVLGGAIQLAPGLHSLACLPQTRLIALWVGPTLNSLPLLGGGDPLTLFQNWY